MRQVLGPGALGRPGGIRWRGRWERGSGWGRHVNPRLFHFNVWQNSLQIKKIKIKKEEKRKKKRKKWEQNEFYIFCIWLLCSLYYLMVPEYEQFVKFFHNVSAYLHQGYFFLTKTIYSYLHSEITGTCKRHKSLKFELCIFSCKWFWSACISMSLTAYLPWIINSLCSLRHISQS